MRNAEESKAITLRLRDRESVLCGLAVLLVAVAATVASPSPIPTPAGVQGQDTTLPQAPVRDSVHYCADATLVEFEDATHWVLHERPEQTGALLANFFAGRPVRAPPDSGAN